MSENLFNDPRSSNSVQRKYSFNVKNSSISCDSVLHKYAV